MFLICCVQLGAAAKSRAGSEGGFLSWVPPHRHQLLHLGAAALPGRRHAHSNRRALRAAGDAARRRFCLYETRETAFNSEFCRQLEPSQILSHTKRFLLSSICKSSPTDLSSGQLRQVTASTPASHRVHASDLPPSLLPVCFLLFIQLELRCVDLDPELAAALTVHLDPHSLSPEMDFL